MSKTPRHTDGYIGPNGHLVIPFPNAVAAIAAGLAMTVWVKDGAKNGKILKVIQIPARP